MRHQALAAAMDKNDESTQHSSVREEAHHAGRAIEKYVSTQIIFRMPTFLTCNLHGRYRSGIWKDYSNSTISDIDHDVEVVGWGEENGVKFWHIRNSWGTFWGDMGFFKLERGKDALFIENGDCW